MVEKLNETTGLHCVNCHSPTCRTRSYGVPGAGPVSVPARPAPDRVEERTLHGDRIFCMNFVITYCYPLLKKGLGKECDLGREIILC